MEVAGSETITRPGEPVSVGLEWPNRTKTGPICKN